MKQVVFKVEDALFKKAKIKAVQSDQNMTQYLTALIEADLNEQRGMKELKMEQDFKSLIEKLPDQFM